MIVDACAPLSSSHDCNHVTPQSMRFWGAGYSRVCCPHRTHSHGRMEGRKGEARRERIGGRRARERATERESRAPPSLFLLALSSPLSKVGIGYEVSFRCDPGTHRGEGSRVSSVSLILVRVAEGRSYPSHSEASEAASIHAPRCSRVLVRRLSGQGGHEEG